MGLKALVLECYSHVLASKMNLGRALLTLLHSIMNVPLILMIFITSTPATAMEDVRQIDSNMWREDRQAVIKADMNTLYSKDRHCVPPEPAPAVQELSHHNTTWSILFSRYTLDAGDELDVWMLNQERYNETEDQKYQHSYFDIIIPVFFPVFFGVFLIVSVFVVPFVGAMAFWLFELFWWSLTHEEIRRIARRIVIMNERAARRRQRILMPAFVKKPPQRHFRLPHCIRLYPDEDVPSELEESSSGEDWSEPETTEHAKVKVNDEGGATLSGLNTTTSEEEPEPEVNEQEGQGLAALEGAEGKVETTEGGEKKGGGDAGK